MNDLLVSDALKGRISELALDNTVNELVLVRAKKEDSDAVIKGPLIEYTCDQSEKKAEVAFRIDNKDIQSVIGASEEFCMYVTVELGKELPEVNLGGFKGALNLSIGKSHSVLKLTK